MSFVLRIFFSGLIALVPSPDDQRLTVLLVEADAGYRASDGVTVEPHLPLLLARAASCSGPCREQWQSIANLIYRGGSRGRASAAHDQLASALRDGGAWKLSDSDLSIERPAEDAERQDLMIVGRSDGSGGGPGGKLPRTPAERQRFTWLAEIGRIVPEAAVIDPSLLAEHPAGGRIAARWILETGRVATFSLVRVGSEVIPLEFRTLGGARTEGDYVQGLADWMVVDVPIEGCEVELVDRAFAGGETRRMRLSPESCDGGVVEVALLNVPTETFEPLPPGRSAADSPPEPGRHFVFYELARVRPPVDRRPVPHAAGREGVAWSTLQPASERSPLLEALGLGGPRGPADRVICPMARFLGPSAGAQETGNAVGAPEGR